MISELKKLNLHVIMRSVFYLYLILILFLLAAVTTNAQPSDSAALAIDSIASTIAHLPTKISGNDTLFTTPSVAKIDSITNALTAKKDTLKAGYQQRKDSLLSKPNAIADSLKLISSAPSKMADSLKQSIDKVVPNQVKEKLPVIADDVPEINNAETPLSENPLNEISDPLSNVTPEVDDTPGITEQVTDPTNGVKEEMSKVTDIEEVNELQNKLQFINQKNTLLKQRQEQVKGIKEGDGAAIDRGIDELAGEHVDLSELSDADKGLKIGEEEFDVASFEKFNDPEYVKDQLKEKSTFMAQDMILSNQPEVKELTTQLQGYKKKFGSIQSVKNIEKKIYQSLQRVEVV